MRIFYAAVLTGKAGIYILKKALPELKKSRNIDFTLVCADGATGGNGLGQNHAVYIHKLGANVITTGACCFYKKDLVEHWEKIPYVLRPANLDPDTVPGRGWGVFTCPAGRVAAAVLLGNSAGRMKGTNPFTALPPLLEKLRAKTPHVIVDFHSWASGEKRTLFAAARGLCTAVIGTHTRIQSADEEIFDGTAVISSAGRTGSAASVGGADRHVRIREYLTGIPDWTKDAWEKPELQGVLIDADDRGRALSIERIRIPVIPPAGNGENGDAAAGALPCPSGTS